MWQPEKEKCVLAEDPAFNYAKHMRFDSVLIYTVRDEY